ncbi:MAG: malate dehydrogenase [Candidatus Magasanikbacteria bacterium RIFOXYD2_FULL_36_9]|uniref:Malate dehydrogenase n=1 Tax=Candidatus Magasanikbacteria bacterium RIFOXYD2_FULL_36_9 TaxID=1798707 RepID=A0A1F6NY94_9BACT|nr:MAG: malate dehydrogenase [Candidatus Magasanikbacteria bacterium RIFOXYD2_FULL_36_9]
MSIDQISLKLHKKLKGKLETRSKIKISNKKILSAVYTPGVAAVSKAIAVDSKLAKLYTIKGNTIAVISDGSAVLGLGNIGPLAALPVMEGKAALFKEFANLDAFPICLETQDTEEIIKTVKNISPVFGGINLEDISAPRCFEIEKRLMAELDIPVMHDDQRGTATVVLAALINALKIKKLKFNQARIVVNGAGAAGTAVAKAIYAYGGTQIIVCDSHGVIHSERTDLTPEKKMMADWLKPEIKNINTLEDALVGADIFVGVSKANLLTPIMIKSMAKQPIIFALANPTPEIMPEIALKAGAFIVATGRSDFPNQINNVLAFPGIFRGALDNHVTMITDAMLVKAAQNLAACVKNPTTKKILPDPFDKKIVRAVAKAIKKINTL